MKRKLIVTGGGLALTLFAFVAVWLAGSALSAPVNQSVGNVPPDLNGRRVEFSSASGATIRGWLIDGRKEGGAIVLLHGLRANRLSMVERARFLSRAGYAVLLFDFQAHGESTGQHITFGGLESMDAQAAVDFLHHAVPDEKIGLIGVSMGGAAALLASPKLDVQAFVLEMVYPTISEAVINRLTMRLGKYASVLTPLLTSQLKPRLGVAAQALRPIDKVKNITAPKLFIAGAEDEHTTIEESVRLFDAACEPKQIWIVNGAKHQDLHKAAKEQYEKRVLDFFQQTLRR